ncbi:MAG: UDP-N-acetylmuramoyl-tripeptide--D-alanyl-D-alanine ligase [Deltaproteobacteria bacterium]|nr:UDP-N-acetylmuramoyl-tripeptide--D-alanyl-D-alanine ligase [Deltaproteobacteria bacterium]
MNQRRSLHLIVREIVSATGGSLRGAGMEGACEGISTDSRHVIPGNLFVALRGDTYDGHEYAAESVDRGAAGILIHKGREDIIRRLSRPVPVIIVADTLEALGDIACFWRMQFPVPVIAVTGSSGKTTTKDMTAAIMERKMNVLRSRGNFNNLVGLPLSLLEMRHDHDAVIVEMGTNHPGEIGRLAAIARPTAGVVTNVGPAHLEGFGTIAAVGEEKCSLFSRLEAGGTAVINADDDELAKFAQKLSGPVVTFGIRRSANVRAGAIEPQGAAGIRFSLEMGGTSRDMYLPLVGLHNVYNALAAAAASGVLGAGPDDVYEGLKDFTPPSGRMSITLLNNGVYLVDDAYNANPASMKEALETLRQLRGGCSSYVIMGDMLELGSRGEALHEEIGEICGATGVRKLLHRGDYSSAVIRGAGKAGMTADRFIAAGEPDAIAAEMETYIERGDWILVKGSRKMKMERYVEAFIRKIGIDESRGRGLYIRN